MEQYWRNSFVINGAGWLEGDFMKKNRNKTGICEAEINEAGNYLIHVLDSLLKNQKPQEKPEAISFRTLFNLAKFHSVAAMAYYGVEMLHVRPEEKLEQSWKKYRDVNSAKSFVQLSERERILDTFIEKGIAVLPLKGCLLKEMYPQSDYREMADLDILFDASKGKQARAEMERMGYVTKQFDKSNHDNYEKPPYMGVELHRDMLPKRAKTYSYYNDVWTKAIEDEGRPGCYHFSWDDYYIFMLAHAAKHYFAGGSGIRTIMDIHVFLQKYGRELNQGYLKQELNKMRLWQFKQDAEKLAGIWFDGKEPDTEMQLMAQYVLTSGVYGTRERRIENDIRAIEEQTQSGRLARMIYFLRRCFMEYSEMRKIYPVLDRLPMLLPFCWLHRLIWAVLTKKDRVACELRGIRKR